MEKSGHAVRVSQIALANDEDVLLLRRRIKQLLRSAGIRENESTKFVTAVSEIARNALQYAKGGMTKIDFINNVEVDSFISVKISDEGPGIKDLDSILEGRYESKTGMGKGLRGASRLSDDFEIETSDNGTKIVLYKNVGLVTRERINDWASNNSFETSTDSIDEFKRQNRELMQALETADTLRIALEEANRHRSNFLATMSHEIRTPMNAIVGITNILGRSPLGKEQHRLIDALRDAGESLLTIINDVLDLSKIDAGKLDIERNPFDPVQTAHMAVSLLIPGAEEKNITLKLLIDPLTPETIVGDQMRFRQILLNLIGNSIKYSNSGESLVFLTRNPWNGSFRCCICDTGIGMTNAELNRAFEPFEQVRSYDGQHGGTGLGLPIVKRLVELLEGSLWVESSRNYGTAFAVEFPISTSNWKSQNSPRTFHVDGVIPESVSMYLKAFGLTPQDKKGADLVCRESDEKTFWLEMGGRKKPAMLPLAPSSLATFLSPGSTTPVSEYVQVREEPPLATHLKSAKLLVVEDHPINRFVMETELLEHGFEVDLTGTGEDALLAITNNEYDLVLMDCQLPGIDGYEVTRRVRQLDNPQKCRIPIVALTAYAMQGDRQKCLSAGMDDYLSKPVMTDQLLAVIRRWVGSMVVVDNAETPVMPLFLEPIDTQLLSERYKPAKANTLLEMFILDADEMMNRVTAQIESERFDKVARDMHSFKGACALVFAVELADKAKILEKNAKEGIAADVITSFSDVKIQYDLTKKYVEEHVIATLQKPES